MIHHAAAHPDKLVLGALADLRPRSVDRQAGHGQKGVRAGDFERGRRAGARADRHVGPDDEVCPAKGPAALQHERHAEDIVAPVAVPRRGRRIEIELRVSSMISE